VAEYLPLMAAKYKLQIELVEMQWKAIASENSSLVRLPGAFTTSDRRPETPRSRRRSRTCAGEVAGLTDLVQRPRFPKREG
jgi:hypothetical protein